MALETALMVSYAQILEGEAPCDSCDKPAQVTLHAEPDYHDTPMCWRCARGFVSIAFSIADKWWYEPVAAA